MKILMLEQNVLLDRRVVLMARSLEKAGHEVKIINEQPKSGWWERLQTEFETIPFPTSQEDLPVYGGDGFMEQPDFVKETIRPWGISRRRVLERGSRVEHALQGRGFSGAPLYAALGLRNPYYLREVLRDRWKHRPILRRLGVGLLGIAALPTALRLLPEDSYSGYSPGGVPLSYWDKCVLAFADRVWRPDVVVANDFPTLRAAAACRQRLGVKVVYDAHELYAYQPGMEFDRSKKIFAEERKLLKFVDASIVLNKAQGLIMERDSGWSGPQVTCPNATDTPPGFDRTKRYNRVRERVAIPQHHHIMMFQGGINQLRRTDYILKGLAMATRRDVHMVFLTFGSEVEGYRKMADRLGVGARVHFLPYQPWDEIVYWAASVECGFLPYAIKDQNSALGGPNKMFEFINAGTPMIGPWDNPTIRNMLQRENFGLVAHLREVEDYAHAIDDFFDETKGGWQRFRPALVEKASKYHWDEQVNDVLGLYAEIEAGLEGDAARRRAMPGLSVEAFD